MTAIAACSQRQCVPSLFTHMQHMVSQLYRKCSLLLVFSYAHAVTEIMNNQLVEASTVGRARDVESQGILRLSLQERFTLCFQ